MCSLRVKVYPSMVQKFYIEMCSITQDAICHTVIVCGVYFKVLMDVIAELLRIYRVAEIGEITTTAQARTQQLDQLQVQAHRIYM